MSIIKKIEQMRIKRGWSVYKLAELSGLSEKCIYNWYHRNSMPTVQALEGICDAFGITLSQLYVGGFAGYCGVIDGATNSGTINSTGVIVENSVSMAYVGGIAGYCRGMNNCTNNVDIQVTTMGKYVGGLAGYISCSSVQALKNDTNNGKVSGRENVGGIAGYIEGSTYSDATTIENCENNAEIAGTTKVGGIFGSAIGTSYSANYSTYYRNIQITYCKNTAQISGDSYVGGIVGAYTRLITTPDIINTNTTTYGNLLGQ